MNPLGWLTVAAVLAIPLMTCTKVPDKIASYILEAAESKSELCLDSAETRERVRTIMLKGLDQALEDRIGSLYEVWMKDDTGQPERARKGLDNAIRAYAQAYQGVQTWSPPICPAG